MKSKVSLKTIIVLIILALVGVLSFLGMGAAKTYLSGASAGAEPKAVLATPSEDGKSVNVSWSTDKAVQAVVEYGTTPASLLLRSLETDATVSHKVTISPLKPATSYYFRIRVGEEVFDNSGIPYSFKTKGSGTNANPGTTDKVTSAPKPSQVLPTQTGQAGGCDRTKDYNNDGVVNSMDFVKCMSGGANGQKPTTSTSSAVTPSAAVPTKSTASPSSANKCDNVDYDKNGVINSIDRIKCLQAK